jgi:hypothetical protein
LDRTKPTTIQRRFHAAGFINLLRRVGHQYARDHRIGTRSHGAGNCIHESHGDKWSGRIVNQHHIDISGKCAKRGADRVLSALPAGHDPYVCFRVEASQQRAHIRNLVRRSSNNNKINRTSTGQRAYGVHQHRYATQLAQRLRSARP